jgi:arylsulfatase A-like enzyme
MKILTVIVILFSLFLNACTQKEVIQRPNIIWLTSEDNSKHYMELFDEHGVKTPNIERLTNNGIIFTRAFSNAPVCSAARSTLISGCYGPRLASHYHRRVQKVPMSGTMKMFPAYLREAGYYTSNNSKEDYNIVKGDSVWDESSSKASWKKRNQGQPFFHVQNTTTTHESKMFYKDEDMNMPDTLTDRNSCFIQPNHPQTEIFKYLNARYRDLIIKMDREIGAMIDELEKEGLLENTFIFYYGDHGGVLPGSKGYMKETGLHVPLVVHIPEKYKNMVDLERGTESSAFVSFVDFGATVLNLAGVEIPEGMDGKAFLGKGVSKSELDSRDETYSYADRFDEKYDMVRSVRKGKYKYVRNYQPFNYDGLWNNYRYKQAGFRQWLDMYKKGELNDIQAEFFKTKKPELLYDVEADPFETINLAENPNNKEVLEQLRGKLDSWLTAMPDLSFYPEHHLVNNAFDNPVAFGQTHKADIEEYIQLANLMLLDYESAKPGIGESLKSNDPWKRYWGLIVCSRFEKQASEFLTLIKEIALSDSELINRVRAAEFIGITGVENPSKLICQALYESKDGTEAGLILNSVVLMRDGYGFDFNIDVKKFAPVIAEAPYVIRRLQYLGLAE